MLKFILMLVLFLCASPHTSSATELDSTLFATINERLQYMEGVALYKAQNQLAIEDTERERVVISSTKKFAADKGLDPDSIERFFMAQINAAKAIQYRYRAELLTISAAPARIDLQSEIRPALDRLGARIVDILTEMLANGLRIDETSRQEFYQQLDNRFLTSTDKGRLFEAILEVRLK